MVYVLHLQVAKLGKIIHNLSQHSTELSLFICYEEKSP